MAVLVVLGLAIACVIAFAVPPLVVSVHNVPNPVERLRLQNDVRTTLLSGIAGIFFFTTAYFTARQLQTAREQLAVSQEQLRINERGHVTERMTRAVDQLASDSRPAQVGAIYALERLAQDHEELRSTFLEIVREPDATLLKACGNRRASVCPSCSATYQADQFHLLAAGLRGGKGIPETVSGHARLFVTFTAPSFGQVHSRRAQGLLVHPCHPYRQGQRCPHGRRAGCWQRHNADDPRLGEPLCPRC